MSEYTIIVGSCGDVMRAVRAAMAKGWECTGGVAYDGKTYMQAMVRYPAYVPKGRELMKGEGG